MTIEDALRLIQDEYNRAKGLYPQWPVSKVVASAIVAEESGELVKSCLDYEWHAKPETYNFMQDEAVQTAAMALRFLTDSIT